jgi:large subunit ribosomal protein L10
MPAEEKHGIRLVSPRAWHGDFYFQEVAMPTEKKAKAIEQLKDLFTTSKVGIFTDYRGLKVGEITDLRRTFKKSNIHYQVVKNTLARIAAEQAGKKQILDLFEGPLAIAFSQGEPNEPAKILVDFMRATKLTLGIKGGFMGDRALTPAEVQALATIPSREVLIAQVMTGIQGPVAALVAYLASPISGLISLLQQRMKQMEGK